MSTYIFHLTGAIYWRLPTTIANEMPLIGFQGWSIVSPTIRFHPLFDRAPSPILRVGSDECWFFCPVLALRHDSGSDDATDHWETARAISEQFLHRLRFISKQATIPRFYHFAHGAEEPGVSRLTELSNEKFPGVFVPDHINSTVVTGEALYRTVTLTADYRVPVHGDVLLDAIEAQVTRDYRKAILYSSIAMESAALAHLETAYDTALCAEPSDPRLRLIDVQAGGGKISRKDPVYERLCVGDDFGKLLHERPLYLLGRSLLLDAPNQYRDARELYKTRNKIAHRGDATASATVFQPTHDGAIKAIDVAISVFQWFGEEAGYTPFRGDAQLRD